jgi:hypothetical protein
MEEEGTVELMGDEDSLGELGSKDLMVDLFAQVDGKGED